MTEDGIKKLIYKNDKIHPTFFSYSLIEKAKDKDKECGAFFGIGAGFIISNGRLSRDFNRFNKKNWEFPEDAVTDNEGNLILFNESEK